MGKPLKIGIVGAGKISRAYLATLERLTSVQFLAVTDLDRDRARTLAQEGSAGGAENEGRSRSPGPSPNWWPGTMWTPCST
ncbi:hypothetical protein [Streptomyces rhizosphaericus]|uniref:hypothetical protein n=1 Tax=Streptomyces rhizosphaericus TaxID=114699 RepID=UPI0035D45511